MSNKTPMIQLLEKLEFARKQLQEKDTITPEEKGYDDCLTNIINDIQLQMISIEKQCISDAFGCGFSDKYKTLSGEQYYNNTFGTIASGTIEF